MYKNLSIMVNLLIARNSISMAGTVANSLSSRSFHTDIQRTHGVSGILVCGYISIRWIHIIQKCFNHCIFNVKRVCLLSVSKCFKFLLKENSRKHEFFTINS